MKVVIIGGHLAPALAVIEKLNKDHEIIFIGRKFTFEGDDALSLEYHVISERGIKFYELKTGRLQRKLTRTGITALFKTPRGFFSAVKILTKERPDVVVGFGGYLSLPVALAAKTLGIPIVIHEQTLETGLANKIIGKFADRICISWKSSEEFFPISRTELTGNPIRREILTPEQIKDADLTISGKLPLVFITGGSAGSHAINEAIFACIDTLLDHAAVIHQTGDASAYNDYEKLEQKKNTLSEAKKSHYRLRRFIKPEMVGSIMKEAAIVIGRAGINTVTELIYLRKPALLIPLPHGQKLEQQKNAKMLQSSGLAEVIDQDDLTSELLIKKLTSMLGNLKKYTMGEDYKEYIIAHAASRICEVIENVAKEKNNKKKK